MSQEFKLHPIEFAVRKGNDNFYHVDRLVGENWVEQPGRFYTRLFAKRAARRMCREVMGNVVAYFRPSIKMTDVDP